MAVKLAVFDIDGTLTDGTMTFDERGGVSKSYHAHDIAALFSLQYDHKIPVLILTGSHHKCDGYRFNFLRVDSLEALKGIVRDDTPGPHLLQGVHDKWPVLFAYLKEREIDPEDITYFGDFDNDAECMTNAGFAGCPGNAPERIKNIVSFVTRKPSGAGAASEFAEAIVTLHKAQPGNG